jgi:GAF domain-containing protein
MSDNVLQLTRERDRLLLLLDVNNAVVSHLDLRDLLQAISAFLRRLVPHEFSSVAIYDPESNQFRLGALDYPEHQSFLRESDLVPIEGTPAGLAFKTGKPTMRKLLDLEEFPSEIMKRLAARGVKSGCSVPLISHERVLGVLSLGSTRDAAFNEDDVELLGQIGKQVSIAVENALNFGSALEAQKELRRERDRSQLLLDVTNAVISHLDLRVEGQASRGKRLPEGRDPPAAQLRGDHRQQCFAQESSRPSGDGRSHRFNRFDSGRDRHRERTNRPRHSQPQHAE